MSCKSDRGLDSPDSGLPPSPSPSAWLLPGAADTDAGKATPAVGPPLPAPGCPISHLPLSYGEGIVLSPLPDKDMRFTSCVSYNSDRHFIQKVDLQPWGQELDRCRQTIMVLPHSTWRHYKTQLDLEPRYRPHQFRSTTIVYPKKTSVLYTTELNYNHHRQSRHFISSVEFEASGQRKLQQ